MKVQMSALYGRWKFQNTIQDHYIGIINVEKTESYYLTETINLKTIKPLFQAKGVMLSNVRFLAFDGTKQIT